MNKSVAAKCCDKEVLLCNNIVCLESDMYNMRIFIYQNYNCSTDLNAIIKSAFSLLK